MSRRRLTLLQINDLHGYIEPHPEVFPAPEGFRYQTCGGLARIATIFEDARRANPGGVLALDNGDTFHGTYVTVQSKGMAIVPLMNALGLDAMTAHWEFAYGPDQFLDLARRLDYPVLAINCYDLESGRLVFAPTLVVERGGFRIGVIGIAATIVDKSMPESYSKGLRFTLGNEELPGHIDRLKREERVDLVVVLSHLGFPQDAKLAAEVAGIDILVSGHTHNRLYRPVRVGRTTIIQSGCHGSFVGKLELERDGDQLRIDHTLIRVDESFSRATDMQSLVDEAAGPHRDLLGQVVGHAAAPLDRATSLEASMDNVLLDAIARVADTQLAFSNGWRYGAPILAGDVTLEHLWNVVPTDAPVSTVELTGDELMSMLEANLERTYAANAYHQMGGFVKRCRGLRLFFKMENPKGHRIESLMVDGEAVKGDRLYRAAMLGEQGVPAKFGGQRKKVGTTAIAALRDLYATQVATTGAIRGSVTAV